MQWPLLARPSRPQDSVLPYSRGALYVAVGWKKVIRLTQRNEQGAPTAVIAATHPLPVHLSRLPYSNFSGREFVFLMVFNMILDFTESNPPALWIIRSRNSLR